MGAIKASYLASTSQTDSVFAINVPQVKFGVGVTDEVGYEAKRANIKKALFVVGPRLSETDLAQKVVSSLEEENIIVERISKIKIEPDDNAILEAYRDIKGKKIDGFISLGGGSTIDTAKILNLLHTYPEDLNAYINKPVGKGLNPPSLLKPHIAIPTTAGTGSETTSVAIFDVLKMKAKTGISNPSIRPTIALVDPMNTVSLPPMITASTGLDVLNHAIESYTSHPYTAKPPIKNPAERAVYSGATPVGDIFGEQAIKWVHDYLRRAYLNSSDIEARYYLMLASSVAGIGFGHVGVHVPHAMGYPIAGMIRKWFPENYEFGYPIIPHGIGTAIPGAYAFRYLAPYSPQRFENVAKFFGIETEGMSIHKIADSIHGYYLSLLNDLRIPSTLGELDFTADDIEKLTDGAMAQQRLISLSPKRISRKDIESIFSDAIG